MTKKFIFLVLLAAVFMPKAYAGGDEIELKDGTRVAGNIVAQGSMMIYIDTKDGLKKIDMSEIETLHFGPKLAEKTPEPDTALAVPAGSSV